MQKETKEPGTEINQAEEVKAQKEEAISTDAAMHIVKENNAPEEAPLPVEEEQKEQVKVMMMPPDWKILNGSGKVCMQTARKPDKFNTTLNLWIPGNKDFDIQEKFRSPIPSDTLFFVCDYDPMINVNFRRETLKALGLHEGDKKHDPIIRKLDDNGQLDVIRIGDQVHFNMENFIPVKMKTDYDVYFVIHHFDIMGVNKTYPRTRLEKPVEYV